MLRIFQSSGEGAFYRLRILIISSIVSRACARRVFPYSAVPKDIASGRLGPLTSIQAHTSTGRYRPSVWTGRALQAELVLRICIRPIDGAFELLAIMDIRARSISFTSRPRRPFGPLITNALAKPFSISSSRLEDLGGKAN